jgi:hypothetical protein
VFLVPQNVQLTTGIVEHPFAIIFVAILVQCRSIFGILMQCFDDVVKDCMCVIAVLCNRRLCDLVQIGRVKYVEVGLRMSPIVRKLTSPILLEQHLTLIRSKPYITPAKATVNARRIVPIPSPFLAAFCLLDTDFLGAGDTDALPAPDDTLFPPLPDIQSRCVGSLQQEEDRPSFLARLNDCGFSSHGHMPTVRKKGSRQNGN